MDKFLVPSNPNDVKLHVGVWWALLTAPEHSLAPITHSQTAMQQSARTLVKALLTLQLLLWSYTARSSCINWVLNSWNGATACTEENLSEGVVQDAPLVAHNVPEAVLKSTILSRLFNLLLCLLEYVTLIKHNLNLKCYAAGLNTSGTKIRVHCNKLNGFKMGCTVL